MGVDVRPEIREESKPVALVIDFDKSPQQIEEYKFGEPITRSNFTSFLIQDFRRSQGSPTVQTYSWAWLNRHSGIDVIPALKNFIDKKGLDTLTDEEASMITSAYKKRKHSRNIEQLTTEEDASFSSILCRSIDEAIRFYENQGGTIKLGGGQFPVAKMREDVLNMDKENFMRWQVTEGQDEHLY